VSNSSEIVTGIAVRENECDGKFQYTSTGFSWLWYDLMIDFCEHSIESSSAWQQRVAYDITSTECMYNETQTITRTVSKLKVKYYIIKQ
jgi:hypothetical protein